MFTSTKLAFLVSNTFRTINSTNIFNNLSYFKNSIQRGYAASNFRKNIQNVRYISNKTEIKKPELENVYYGVLTPQIKGVKIISFTTSLGGIVAQPILLQQISQSGGGLGIIIAIGSFVGFFTFVTPFLLHLITRKYITQIDYDANNKKYIATLLTFFCRERKVEFSVDDVKVPDIPGMFTSFEIKGRPVFVDPKLFTDPIHYGKMMGYDKPIDFKLFQNDSSKKDT